MTTPRLLSERYELGDVLGYGGMSEVHRGLDTRLGRDVAIKVLRADLARDPQFQMRFRREAQNAAALNHPAIVAVYDTGEVQSEVGLLPYIVMEYVDGQTLREIVKTQGPLSQQKVLEVMADVCAALDFSHRHQIIHRDVKPANIMINTAGAVKVMDFGIARALGEGQNVTQTAAVIGTAQYLSPEQARGEAVDARSDVYAAGCVIYELLTGEPPFTGDSPVAVAYQHVREDPKPPSEVNPTIPPALDAIVLKALSKNPANRYQSAAEMRSDLIRVRNGQAPMAPAVMSADERTAMMGVGPATGATRRINGRHGVAAPAPAHYAEDYYDDADPGSGNRRTALIVVGVLVVLGLVGFLAYQLLSGPAKPAQIAVPPVVGKSQVDAVNDILNAGLRKGTITQQESPVAQKDKVISTDPPPGTAIDAKSQVNIVVGTGPAQVNVPVLTGQSLAQATDTLKQAGLTPGKTTDDPTLDATKIGNVTDSDPKAGAQVKGGTVVNLTVGVKQTAVKVPPVTGKSAADAANALQGVGLQSTTQDVDGTEPQGTVVDTDPKAGQSVPPNSTVTLKVSRGNQQPQIPHVRGMTEDQAKQALKQAGFTNITVQDYQTDQAADGTALGTNPNEGTQADPNQQIILGIARGGGNGGNGNGIFTN